jgi:toxin FitB
MTFLLDTNVVSEWTKKEPNAGTIAWLSNVAEDEVYVSVVTLAELRRGIERLPAGRRRRSLDQWLIEELYPRFDGRIIFVDIAIADRWGRIVAQREARGRPIPIMDALLAATAEVHSLTLVTRNEADFRTTVKSLLNPWT